MNRFLWSAAVLLLAAFDAWCLLFHWSAVAGNTAASIMWTTPAVAVHHLLTKRRQDRHHREQTGRAEAQAVQLATVVEKVGELHNWHLRGVLPPETLEP